MKDVPTVAWQVVLLWLLCCKLRDFFGPGCDASRSTRIRFQGFSLEVECWVLQHSKSSKNYIKEKPLPNLPRMSDPRPIWLPLWEVSVSNLSWDFYGSCHLPQWCRPRTVVTRLLVNDSEFEIQTVRNAVIFFRFRWNGSKIVGYPKMDSQATIQRMTGRSLCRRCREETSTSGDSSTGSLPHWCLWISNISCSPPFL